MPEYRYRTGPVSNDCTNNLPTEAQWGDWGAWNTVLNQPCQAGYMATCANGVYEQANYDVMSGDTDCSGTKTVIQAGSYTTGQCEVSQYTGEPMEYEVECGSDSSAKRTGVLMTGIMTAFAIFVSTM